MNVTKYVVQSTLDRRSILNYEGKGALIAIENARCPILRRGSGAFCKLFVGLVQCYCESDSTFLSKSP